MVDLKVYVKRTDDGETLLERTLSVPEYLQLLKNSYLLGLHESSPADDCESGDAYDMLMAAQAAP